MEVDGREDFACLEDVGGGICHIHPGIYINNRKIDR